MTSLTTQALPVVGVQLEERGLVRPHSDRVPLAGGDRVAAHVDLALAAGPVQQGDRLRLQTPVVLFDISNSMKQYASVVHACTRRRGPGFSNGIDLTKQS